MNFTIVGVGYQTTYMYMTYFQKDQTMYKKNWDIQIETDYSCMKALLRGACSNTNIHLK